MSGAAGLIPRFTRAWRGGRRRQEDGPGEASAIRAALASGGVLRYPEGRARVRHRQGMAQRIKAEGAGALG
jgi:hypothetical protein